MSQRPQERPQRVLFPDMRTLRRVVGRSLPSPEAKRWQEHVYFDTAHPSLPFSGFVRARRFVDGPRQPAFAPQAAYQIEHRNCMGSREVLANRARLDEVPQLVTARLGAERLGPCFGVRFRRRRFRLEGLELEIDRHVRYFSLAGGPFLIGRERSPRVCARGAGDGREVRRLGAWMQGLPVAPFTTKKWMGYHFLKECYELPRNNELPGFEYELKLAVDDLNIDRGQLPFPVLEVHQSDSLRGYYETYRACIRGDRAHAVEKGPVTNLRGVLKRPERKTFGLVPWELPSPQMVMRRYKREINVFNPDTLRVYTLSIHHCDAGRTFQQLEIEYDGVLSPDATAEMARFREDHDPAHFLAMARRADSAGYVSVARELVTRYQRFATSKFRRPSPTTTVGPKEPPKPAPVDPAVERAVVNDMLLLRDALVRCYGFRQTNQSKRKWLTKLHSAEAET